MHQYDLEEIKREIVEGRSLTIKTNHLVSALSADLKSIGKRQQNYERRMFFQSITAYVVVVLIILGLSKVALDAQVAAVRAESRDQRERVKSLEAEIVQSRERLEARETASREAEKLYTVSGTGEERKFLEGLPALLRLDLTSVERSVFEEAGRRAKRRLSMESYQAGIEHARAGRFHEASQLLRESLDLEMDAPHSPQAAYELARAFRALDLQKSAIPLLFQLTEATSSPDILDEATLLLAECQVDVELYADAKSTLRTFLRRFDKSPLKLDAQKLLSELNLKH